MIKLTSMRVNPRDTATLSAMLDKANGTAEFDHKITISSLFRKFIRRCISDSKFYRDFIKNE